MGRAPTLERGLTDLLGLWTLLASQGALAAAVGPAWATLLVFAAASLLAVFVEWHAASRPMAGIVGRTALGALLGYALQPVALALIAGAGLALGLAPTPVASVGSDAIGSLCRVALAPLFEEIVYRQRVLMPLAARIGQPLAVLLTSVLFALPHVHPWPLLGTFLVGLGLGAVRLAGRSLALCVGVHAGLNARVSMS